MISTPPNWLEKYALGFLQRYAPAGRGALARTSASGNRVNARSVYRVSVGLGPGLCGMANTSAYMSHCSDDRPVVDMLHEFGERHAQYDTVEEVADAERARHAEDRRVDSIDFLNHSMGVRRSYGVRG